MLCMRRCQTTAHKKHVLYLIILIAANVTANACGVSNSSVTKPTYEETNNYENSIGRLIFCAV